MKTAPDSQTATALQAKPEFIRPELNLEKWPIWSPSKSKNEAKAKILEREITAPDGNRITATVEISPTTRGALTTEDQKVMYGLVKLWEDNGKPVGPVYFSKRSLAKCCGKKWGTNVSDSLDQSLTRLRITPFIWQNAYFDKSTGEAVEVIDTFNILSDLKLVKRKKAGEQSREEGYYKFNDFILKNLLSNYTKPLLLDVVLKFNSELAQLLYVHLDLMLNNRPIYERRTKELFDDLGLEGDSYKHAANRKQLLERAFKELLGVPLSTGILNTAKLQKTIDGKDHKAVFRKGNEVVLAVPPPRTIPNTDKEEEPKPILDIEAEARELVRYFFQTFHKTSKTMPSTKAVDQAVGLIAQVGYEQAKYVVDFSKEAAQQTNFSPATFGGIMQYVGRALAQFEEKQKEKEELAPLNEWKAQAKNCPYCLNHEGFVITKKGARKCTHNPEIEKQFVKT